MTTEDIANRFDAKRRGASWEAICPCHDDKRASLTITSGRDGKVIMKCGAGCATDAVLATRGLSLKDLFSDDGAPKISPAGMTRATPVATYRYTDETGAHLYDVVRFAPKGFRQRRADGAWTMDGVRRVLYRLPELKGQKTAWYSEGEKDADNLRTLGLTATTSLSGAGKWRSEYADQLKAAGVEHVVVLPDNDAPGRAHAYAVAASCHAAGLKTKIVTLPDVPPKGDASDWLAVGHTKAELIALAKVAPTYAPTSSTTPTPSRAPIITRLDTVTTEDVDWIWPGRIARGKLTGLYGEPGIGKSYFTCDLAARISRGALWPDGTRAPQGSVLFVTAEDGIADTIKPRLVQLGADCTRIAVVEAIQDRDGTRRTLSLADHLPQLAEAIRTVEPTVVVLDPITAFLAGIDAHRDNEVRSTLAPLIDLATQTRCALVIVGHLSKDMQRAALHRAAGSIAFVASARMAFALAADPQDADRRVLVGLKTNLGKPAPALAFRIDGHGVQWESGPVTGVSADAMLRPVSADEREAAIDADAVVRDLLNDATAWPLDAVHALEAGAAHGINDRSMQRAAGRAGIGIKRSGFGRGGRWLWHRPSIDDTSTVSKTPGVSSMSSMQKVQAKATNNNIDDTESAFTRARETAAPIDDTTVAVPPDNRERIDV